MPSKLLCITTLLAILAIPGVRAATADEWKSRSIYQLVTDRFARSDNGSASCDTSQRVYCGGSWKGITNHLDYIQGLGFDAVWISPIVKNINGTSPYGEAYHGYWTEDINGLNTNFGSEDDLKELSNALHTRKMFLMLDVVINHFAALNVTGQDALDFASIQPFNSATQYHPECLITDFNNQTDVEQCWLGDVNFPLPDLNTEDPTIVQTMNDWIGKTVQTYGVDGLRIDTAKHIRKDFWPDFVKSAGVYSVGEVITDQVSYAGPYTQVLDGVLDYPAYFALTKAFNAPSGNLSGLVDVLTAGQATYKNGVFPTASFLENHDQPRFQNITADQALVRNAITWTFTQDGIPILYYGQEQGFAGSGDPANREALWPSGYITSGKPLVSHVQALNAVRKLAISKNSNFLSTPAKPVPQTNPATIAISKPPLLTLLTNTGSSGTGSTSWTIPSSSGLFQHGDVFVDALTCSSVSPNSNGDLVVQVQGGSPQVLIPTSSLSKDGSLCSNMTTGTTGSKNSAVGGLGRQATWWIASIPSAMLAVYLMAASPLVI